MSWEERKRASAVGRSTEQRSRRRRRALTIGIAWALFAFLAAPLLIIAFYLGWLPLPAGQAAHELATLRAGQTLGEVLFDWLWFAVWPFVAIGTWYALAAAMESSSLLRRQIHGATANSVAWIRILVCLTAILVLLWEDVPSTALLPREMADWEGVFAALRWLPGVSTILASQTALTVLELLTLALLAAALVGWKTRVTLPAAATGYLLLAGLMRLYSRLFHTGLVPVYLLVALCFTPCADALAWDRRDKAGGSRPRPQPDPRYGWARWSLWAVLALTYFEAGLSKVRDGGLLWWHPDNLRSIVATDCLSPMHFDFDLGMNLVIAPDALVAFLALSALAIEMTFPAVLFSRLARWVLPAGAIAMHVGILFLQNVAFFDLMLLQLMFLDLDLLKRPAKAVVEGERRLGSRPRWFLPFAAILLATWALKIEAYPFSAMQMYSDRNRSGTIEYLRVTAEYDSGRLAPAPLEEAIPAMADARYRWLLAAGFDDDEDRRLAARYLKAAGRAWNSQHASGKQIIAFTVTRRRWNFRERPEAVHSETPGRLLESYRVRLNGGEFRQAERRIPRERGSPARWPGSPPNGDLRASTPYPPSRVPGPHLASSRVLVASSWGQVHVV